MLEDRREVLDVLSMHAWPAGFRVEREGDVLRVSAAPLRWVDAAVVAGVAIVIPAVVIVLSRNVIGIAAGVLFAFAVLGIGFQRFRGAQRITVDVVGERVHFEHVNPGVARRLGITARSAGFADIASVEVSRVLMGSRTEPHGRRVALRFVGDTEVILGEFAAPATGLLFARSIGSVLGAPVRER